jgi:hypothetical protein
LPSINVTDVAPELFIGSETGPRRILILSPGYRVAKLSAGLIVAVKDSPAACMRWAEVSSASTKAIVFFLIENSFFYLRMN